MANILAAATAAPGDAAVFTSRCPLNKDYCFECGDYVPFVKCNAVDEDDMEC